MRYVLRDGFYCLEDDNTVLSKSEEVSILFDTGGIIGWVLLKHGDPERVLAYSQVMTKKYTVFGLGDFIKGLKVMTGKFPVDELNHLINSSGYGKIFYEKMLALDKSL